MDENLDFVQEEESHEDEDKFDFESSRTPGKSVIDEKLGPYDFNVEEMDSKESNGERESFDRLRRDNIR